MDDLKPCVQQFQDAVETLGLESMSGSKIDLYATHSSTVAVRRGAHACAGDPSIGCEDNDLAESRQLHTVLPFTKKRRRKLR
jgi:hypothetical protein